MGDGKRPHTQLHGDLGQITNLQYKVRVWIAKHHLKKKKKKAPQVSFWSAFVTAISLSTHLGEVCPSLPRRAFCQLGSTLTLRGGKVRPARVHVMPLQTMCQSQIIVN